MRIALRSAKDPWDVVSPLETYRRNVINNNVGNLIFGQAVHRALSTRQSEVVSNRSVISRAEAARINAECEVFVLPLANAFRPSFTRHLERLTAMIERLKVPVVVVGVGAQAKLHQGTQRLDPLSATVKRFVSAVLDRSATIGVRGEFTADYLQRLGFDAVDVIGCPSMYMWGSDLRVQRKVAALDESAKVSLGVSPYVKAMGPIITTQLAHYEDLTYLAQDRETLGRLIARRPDASGSEAQDLPIRRSHPLLRDDKTLFFVDPSSWMAYLRTRDFTLGTRIHGTITSLLSGTPALLLVHDTRTLELARFHRIPFRRIRQVDPGTPAADLYADLNLNRLHRAHNANFENYRAFLERNGLPHVWQPGESPAAFDARLAATTFPGPAGIVRLTPTLRIRSLAGAVREVLH